MVGTALAVTSLSLKDRQQANIDADKMRQILAAIHVAVSAGENVEAVFARHIVSEPVFDASGRKLDLEAFDVNIASQSTLSPEQRQLPVYVARIADGSKKFIVPLYGSGLWGPIWGYVAIDSDGSTIYGAFFAHQGETPGLGAEIEKPSFSDQFDGKRLLKNGHFMPVTVVKKGMRPLGNEDYVDGISGGTITSKGVSFMLDNCLSPYNDILKILSENN